MSIKKIGPYLTGAVENSGKPSKTSKDGKSGSSGGISSDRVELSQSYRDLSEVRRTLMASVDIRTDKVEQVKNQLDSGNYQINPDNIADKMLEEVV